MRKKISILFVVLLVTTTSFAQKWYQLGFKISTNFPTNREYSLVGDYLDNSINADFGFFFRAGKYVFGEVGLGYAFFKGDFSNEFENFKNQRVEIRHMQIPIKIVGNVRLSRSCGFLPFAGIIYQPTLKLTANNCGYALTADKGEKLVEKNSTLLTAGFDLKFGPIVFGVNYRYGLQTFFTNYDGKHPQFVNLCAGFQF